MAPSPSSSPKHGPENSPNSEQNNDSKIEDEEEEIKEETKVETESEEESDEDVQFIKIEKREDEYEKLELMETPGPSSHHLVYTRKRIYNPPPKKPPASPVAGVEYSRYGYGPSTSTGYPATVNRASARRTFDLALKDAKLSSESFSKFFKNSSLLSKKDQYLLSSGALECPPSTSRAKLSNETDFNRYKKCRSEPPIEWKSLNEKMEKIVVKNEENDESKEEILKNSMKKSKTEEFWTKKRNGKSKLEKKSSDPSKNVEKSHTEGLYSHTKERMKGANEAMNNIRGRKKKIMDDLEYVEKEKKIGDTNCDAMQKLAEKKQEVKEEEEIEEPFEDFNEEIPISQKMMNESKNLATKRLKNYAKCLEKANEMEEIEGFGIIPRKNLEMIRMEKQIRANFREKFDNREAVARVKYLQVYQQQREEYMKKLENWEKSSERIELEARVREIVEKTFPEVRKEREDRERQARGDRLRGEDAAAVAARKTYEDKLLHSRAVIPPLYNRAEQAKDVFIEREGAIIDDLEVEHFASIAEQKDKWTIEERKLFKTRIPDHIKNFGAMSEYFYDKTPSDCVAFYYLSKNEEFYKNLFIKKKKRYSNKYRPGQMPNNEELALYRMMPQISTTSIEYLEIRPKICFCCCRQIDGIETNGTGIPREAFDLFQLSSEHAEAVCYKCREEALKLRNSKCHGDLCASKKKMKPSKCLPATLKDLNLKQRAFLFDKIDAPRACLKFCATCFKRFSKLVDSLKNGDSELTEELNKYVGQVQWTEKEIEKLTKLINKFGVQNWPAISKGMKEQRTAMECRRQYEKLNGMKHEEDEEKPEEKKEKEKVEEMEGEEEKKEEIEGEEEEENEQEKDEDDGGGGEKDGDEKENEKENEEENEEEEIEKDDIQNEDEIIEKQQDIMKPGPSLINTPPIQQTLQPPPANPPMVAPIAIATPPSQSAPIPIISIAKPRESKESSLEPPAKRPPVSPNLLAQQQQQLLPPPKVATPQPIRPTPQQQQQFISSALSSSSTPKLHHPEPIRPIVGSLTTGTPFARVTQQQQNNTIDEQVRQDQQQQQQLQQQQIHQVQYQAVLDLCQNPQQMQLLCQSNPEFQNYLSMYISSITQPNSGVNNQPILNYLTDYMFKFQQQQQQQQQQLRHATPPVQQPQPRNRAATMPQKSQPQVQAQAQVQNQNQSALLVQQGELYQLKTEQNRVEQEYQRRNELIELKTREIMLLESRKRELDSTYSAMFRENVQPNSNALHITLNQNHNDLKKAHHEKATLTEKQTEVAKSIVAIRENIKTRETLIQQIQQQAQVQQQVQQQQFQRPITASPANSNLHHQKASSSSSSAKSVIGIKQPYPQQTQKQQQQQIAPISTQQIHQIQQKLNPQPKFDAETYSQLHVQHQLFMADQKKMLEKMMKMQEQLTNNKDPVLLQQYQKAVNEYNERTLQLSQMNNAMQYYHNQQQQSKAAAAAQAAQQQQQQQQTAQPEQTKRKSGYETISGLHQAAAAAPQQQKHMQMAARPTARSIVAGTSGQAQTQVQVQVSAAQKQQQQVAQQQAQAQQMQLIQQAYQMQLAAAAAQVATTQANVAAAQGNQQAVSKQQQQQQQNYLALCQQLFSGNLPQAYAVLQAQAQAQQAQQQQQVQQQAQAVASLVPSPANTNHSDDCMVVFESGVQPTATPQPITTQAAPVQPASVPPQSKIRRPTPQIGKPDMYEQFNLIRPPPEIARPIPTTSAFQAPSPAAAASSTVITTAANIPATATVSIPPPVPPTVSVAPLVATTPIAAVPLVPAAPTPIISTLPKAPSPIVSLIGNKDLANHNTEPVFSDMSEDEDEAICRAAASAATTATKKVIGGTPSSGTTPAPRMISVFDLEDNDENNLTKPSTTSSSSIRPTVTSKLDHISFDLLPTGPMEIEDMSDDDL